MSYYLNDVGVVCALGGGQKAVADALFQGSQAGMVSSSQYQPAGDSIVGQVKGNLPEIPAELSRFQSRNNQLLLAALAEIEGSVETAVERFGRDRVGIVIGTSTSGIAEGEEALRHYGESGEMPAGYSYTQQAIGSVSEFMRAYLNISGPSYTVSTACSSGARALVSARRLLTIGACDAVVVGGADSLCGMTVQGFSSLEAVSAQLCNPFSVNRKGINIGEGAALFLMSREASGIEFLGAGSSSDAHHISAPDPSGAGALRAMQSALDDAGLSADAVDYLNLHGTGTRQNDSMESCAVFELFGGDLPCSSTKPLTGHTLGAAGAIEAAFCWLALAGDDGKLPPQVWDGERDEALPELNLVSTEYSGGERPRVCMSNSFAFGGNNIAVLLGKR